MWALTKLSEGDQHTGNVFRRSSWRLWPKEELLPSCDYIVMSWYIPPVGQTNFDLPTCTVWGCFKAKAYKDNGTEYTQDHAILLGHHHQATTAAEVLKAAKEIYSKVRGTAHIRIILEDTASNAFFRQEMRRSRVPASYWSPKSSTGEKRFEEWALQASTVLDEGRVFYPDKDWARDIVNEVAHFPHGTRADFANSISLLLLFLRARKAIELPLDELEDIEEERLEKDRARFRRRKRFYGR